MKHIELGDSTCSYYFHDQEYLHCSVYFEQIAQHQAAMYLAAHLLCILLALKIFRSTSEAYLFQFECHFYSFFYSIFFF